MLLTFFTFDILKGLPLKGQSSILMLNSWQSRGRSCRVPPGSQVSRLGFTWAEQGVSILVWVWSLHFTVRLSSCSLHDAGNSSLEKPLRLWISRIYKIIIWSQNCTSYKLRSEIIVSDSVWLTDWADILHNLKQKERCWGPDCWARHWAQLGRYRTQAKNTASWQRMPAPQSRPLLGVFQPLEAPGHQHPLQQGGDQWGWWQGAGGAPGGGQVSVSSSCGAGAGLSYAGPVSVASTEHLVTATQSSGHCTPCIVHIAATSSVAQELKPLHMVHYTHRSGGCTTCTRCIVITDDTPSTKYIALYVQKELWQKVWSLEMLPPNFKTEWQ